METHQKINTLNHIDSVVSSNVEAVELDVHQLMHIQNEISRQITITWQEIQELEHNIQVLMRRGVRADAVSPYKHTYQHLQQQFNTMPAQLLKPEHVLSLRIILEL